jgi:hypothetical protein
LDLRLFSIAAALLLLLAGCASRSEEVLPVARSIKGASYVRGTEVLVRQTAAASTARLDARASQHDREHGGAAAMPLQQLLERSVEQATREAGLTSGRALTLTIELDSLAVTDAGGAFFGAKDELAGSVFIRDAETGEELGQLYIQAGRANGGALGVLTRGTGVRERLAQAFARRIAAALAGRKPQAR